MEGSIFVTGAAVQWLRDGLGIIEASSEAGPLAASVPDTDGVVFVPAFTGLGSPYFDPYARGAVFGLTRGTTRAHLVRAVVEAMAWQTADVIDAITAAAGIPLTELRVDGGASAMDVLCQFQADVLGVTVRRPVGRRDHGARRRLPRRDRRRACGRHRPKRRRRGGRTPRSSPPRSPAPTNGGPTGVVASTGPATGSIPTPDGTRH